MSGIRRRFLSALLALIMTAGILPASAFAAQPSVSEGVYSFTLTFSGNTQTEETFLFDEAYFLAPSSEESLPLAELSAQVALASASRFGAEPDPMETDPSDSEGNLTAMLSAMGFEDVESNAYCFIEKLADSAGVTVGRRTIADGGYTLLAVIPRSTGYKQEWAGDFTVGNAGFHEGFRAGRDEILRFVKSYVEKHGISGDVKLWTVGQSRGAALANLTAGFFAGGGDAYLGGGIHIAPEDVYCRTTATPRAVRAGISRAEELSVSGPRGGEYAADTPGEPFAWEGEGVCDPGSAVYAGIRSYDVPLDFIPDVPPMQWGYVRYGIECASDAYGAGTEEMLSELLPLHPKVHAALSGAAGEGFTRWTFDPETMEMVPESVEEASLAHAFLAQRMEGLLSLVPDAATYVSGYQAAFRALGGAFGMLRYMFPDGADAYRTKLMKPILFSWLAYASERLRAEGRAETEADAAAIALTQLLSFASGESLDPYACTVDDCTRLLAKFIADRAETPAVRDAVFSVADSFPPEAAFLIRMLFSGFQKKVDYTDPAPDGVLLLDFIRACAYGPDPAARSASSYPDAASVRRSLYNLLDLIFKATAPEAGRAIGKTGDKLDGSGSFKGFVAAMMPALLVKKESGRVVRTYADLADAADGAAADAVSEIAGEALSGAEAAYGRSYALMAEGHTRTIAKNVSALRRVLFAFLGGPGDVPYDTEGLIRDACTFIQLSRIALSSHYAEAGLAWLRAGRKAAEG